jgi:hypothetical protein
MDFIPTTIPFLVLYYFIGTFVFFVVLRAVDADYGRIEITDRKSATIIVALLMFITLPIMAIMWCFNVLDLIVKYFKTKN